MTTLRVTITFAIPQAAQIRLLNGRAYITIVDTFAVPDFEEDADDEPGILAHIYGEYAQASIEEHVTYSWEEIHG
jgi:hypothetical protein